MSFDVGAIRQIGRYPVENFIAEGGMAWVFRVKDPELFNAPRALKLLKPQAAEGEDYQRFLAEAQILATIQHPNLIHVYDFGQDAETGCHFYTMDYIEGIPLSDVPPDWLDEQEDEEEEEDENASVASVQANVDPNATNFIHVPSAPVKARYTVGDVCDHFCGVLAALARLHRENVVHRDIKPENIFLTHDGIPVLGDLGIAKGRHSPHISEVGRVPGTPLYMSPEHAKGITATVRSDVFSLGLSLYAVLSGETVYDQIEELDAGDSQAVLEYLLSLEAEEEEFEFFSHESIPDTVLEVIETACRINETERYASADDFNDALRDAIDGVSRQGAGGIRPVVAAAIALPVLALIGFFAWQILTGDNQAVATQEALQEAEARAVEAEAERLAERQELEKREMEAQKDIDALKAALEAAKSTVDPDAVNEAALRLAESRVAEAGEGRRAEEARLAEERQRAEEREEAARKELEELKLALAKAKSAPAATAASAPAEDLGLRKAMAEYETAYESRSIEALNRVWSMSRFERAQIERLFDDCAEIRVQLSFADSNVKGSTGRVDYDETIVFRDCEKTRPGSRYSELTASLALRGDQWQIKQIRDR
jgi:serine/threonine-protein kinase